MMVMILMMVPCATFSARGEFQFPQKLPWTMWPGEFQLPGELNNTNLSEASPASTNRFNAPVPVFPWNLQRTSLYRVTCVGCWMHTSAKSCESSEARHSPVFLSQDLFQHLLDRNRGKTTAAMCGNSQTGKKLSKTCDWQPLAAIKYSMPFCATLDGFQLQTSSEMVAWQETKRHKQSVP